MFLREKKILFLFETVENWGKKDPIILNAWKLFFFYFQQYFRSFSYLEPLAISSV